MLRMNPINLYLSVCARYIQIMLRATMEAELAFGILFVWVWRYKDCCYFLLRIYVSWSVKDAFVVVLFPVLLCGVIIYITLMIVACEKWSL